MMSAEHRKILEILEGIKQNVNVEVPSDVIYLKTLHEMIEGELSGRVPAEHETAIRADNVSDGPGGEHLQNGAGAYAENVTEKENCAGNTVIGAKDTAHTTKNGVLRVYKKQITLWLLVLLNNPFNLSFLNTHNFISFILDDLQCAALLVSNLMKNSENEQFYRENEILGNKISETKYYEFLYHLSKKIKLYDFCSTGTDNQPCTAAKSHDDKYTGMSHDLVKKLNSFIKPTDTETLKALKYKIITNQGMYNRIDKQPVLDTLFLHLKQGSARHSLTLSYSISKFNFDAKELLACFYGPVFCREGLWINTLLILCFKVLEKKVHIRIADESGAAGGENDEKKGSGGIGTVSRTCDTNNIAGSNGTENYGNKFIAPEMIADILLKTVFFECKNRYAQKMRETALFLIYCMLRSTLYSGSPSTEHKESGAQGDVHVSNAITLQFLRSMLLSVSLLDNQLECRRAACSILIELQAYGKTEFLPFIDFYRVKRKNNALNLPQEYYTGLLKQRLIVKIFDHDLEMQIICLEWMKKHGKGIKLRQTIKKDEYSLCDLVEEHEFRECAAGETGESLCASGECSSSATSESISYTTALIAYLFLDQIDKIQIIFDSFALEDKKFVFFADAYLKTTIFKHFDFKGECHFYDMVENVAAKSERNERFDHNGLFNVRYIDSNRNRHVSDHNLVFLLDNDLHPHLTMFLHSTLESDFLFKRLLKKKSLSYFLANAFNTKYFAEYLELVRGMLSDREVERVQIGIKCVYTMYRMYGGADLHKGTEQNANSINNTLGERNISNSVGCCTLRELLGHAVSTNLNNYTINYKGDVGHRCRKECLFLLFYLKDKSMNYYIIKYLFDKNKELREIVISFLRELGVLKNVKGYKTVYISGRRSCEGIEHLLSSVVRGSGNDLCHDSELHDENDLRADSTDSRYDVSVNGNRMSTGHVPIDDNTASFLSSLDAEYKNMCSALSSEKALFKCAFLSFGTLKMEYRIGFAKAILSYFVNCDGSIYEVLSWGITEYLIDYLVYVLEGQRREVYCCLRGILNLLGHSHQERADEQSNGVSDRIRNDQELKARISSINDEKLNGLRDEIVKRMQWR
ncbi:hypothetical protein VCUG_00653 [Vavraia culicis subsp. floridensis]|uniref:Uncharacterized protein n=1 Tax=Vavraia culicis (isolate floridensis) TaxID=948595 RepID=L2GVV9_VAVCU|nr:uncharacterized protein VCUG_00653 [Vavraia culicis subsp. floridensis]ELA47811.1 hypothetical protein VCUG_00653 [Vavraia culicis subsp. floridensis]